MTEKIRTAPAVFRAVWNECNIHLKNPEPTLRQKVLRAVWNLFSIVFLPLGIARAIGWSVRFVAKKMVLPSAWFYPRQILRRAKGIFQVCCQNLQNQFVIEKHKMVTPDGVKLNAIHFKHHQSNQDTPTVLFYQSNASISYLGIYLWLIEEAVRRGAVCNFAVFDYRGVGSSKGDAESTRDLLIDGDTALQFVQNHLQVPPHLIHFYGWSLGAGVGSCVKAMHPECDGPMISERSFSSLRSVGDHTIPAFLRPFLFWIPYTAEKEGWNLSAPLDQLKGKTLILFHPNDPTIPLEASAHRAAMKANLNIESLELYQSEHRKEKARERMVDHHFEPLEHYEVAGGRNAAEAAADFILYPFPKKSG